MYREEQGCGHCPFRLSPLLLALHLHAPLFHEKKKRKTLTIACTLISFFFSMLPCLSLSLRLCLVFRRKRVTGYRSWAVSAPTSHPPAEALVGTSSVGDIRLPFASAFRTDPGLFHVESRCSRIQRQKMTGKAGYDGSISRGTETRLRATHARTHSSTQSVSILFSSGILIMMISGGGCCCRRRC